MHLEFVVVGVPISNQSKGTNAYDVWRAAVAAAAKAGWAGDPLPGPLKAVVINFYAGAKPTVDLDNMSKPVLDALEGTVYVDDRQVVQAELTHVRINAPHVIVGVSDRVVAAIRAGAGFVYVRIVDPVDPFPLPR